MNNYKSIQDRRRLSIGAPELDPGTSGAVAGADKNGAAGAAQQKRPDNPRGLVQFLQNKTTLETNNAGNRRGSFAYASTTV